VKRSNLVALALSSFIALGAIAPAFADDDTGLDKAVNGSLIVSRVGGLGAGLFFGVPIAIMRQTTSSYKSMTNGAADKVGGHDFAPSCALASIVTLPAALVVGPLKGTYTGTKNAVVHGFNEPFAAGSFSVGKLEE
jgi:hypothetical protein